MHSALIERAVGLFVLTGVLILLYFSLRYGSEGVPSGDSMTAVARFSNAGGLTKGALVTVAGVPVGSVEKLSLGPDFYALVELRIRKSCRIPADSTASIRSKGLLGDKYVALSPGPGDELLTDGSRITDTESAVDLESLLSRFAFGGVQSEKKPESPAPTP
jgi:phospholipid/cholesterol/gamma-HCH transport system substrate-binding protein